MKKNRKTKIDLIVEKNDGILWGIVEDKGKFTATPYGETIDAVIKNFKELISDYRQLEGKEDKYWASIDLDNIEFDIHYNLEAFFKEFDDLKITSIAKRAGLNESLLRQYATGQKYPSADQAKKIEMAIHQLAEKLRSASIYA